MAMQEQRHEVEELVYRTCLALDAKDWMGFLALCDPAFRYTISTFSPEQRARKPVQDRKSTRLNSSH